MPRVDKYTVIYFTEDGDANASILSRDELEARLSQHYWGDKPRIAATEADLREIGHSFVGIVILAGAPIQPKPVEIATRYEF